MKNQKILTISVAAYNVEDCVEKCLKSLIVDEKHMNKMEVLVQNDGSTDKTAEIVKKFVKKYPGIIKLINKENGGYGSTVNNSISMAVGKYFKILDADDEFDTKNLPEFLDELEKNDVDMVISPYVRVFQLSKRVEQENMFPSQKSSKMEAQVLLSDKCDSQAFSMHMIATRTEILKNSGLVLPKHTLYTDGMIACVPLLYTKTILAFNKPIYIYKIGREGQSVSAEKRVSHSEDFVKVSKAILRASGGKSTQIFDFFTRNNCARTIWNLLFCPVNATNKKRILDFDLFVKKTNRKIWEDMNSWKTIRLLRMVHFSWLAYIVLHIKVRRKILSKVEN